MFEHIFSTKSLKIDKLPFTKVKLQDLQTQVCTLSFWILLIGFNHKLYIIIKLTNIQTSNNENVHGIQAIL